MRGLTIAIVVVAVGAFALWPREHHKPVDPCGATTAKPWDTDLHAAGQATLCLINRERTQRGLSALSENTLLDQASTEHSQDMVTRDYFEHDAPDGRSVSDRLKAVGYARGTNHSDGENIAYGVGPKATPSAIVRAWMNSPPHRADILRPAFTEIGIGIALGAPVVSEGKQSRAATYTTDFGGVIDPALPTG